MTRTRSLQVLIFAALLVLPASTASSFEISLRLAPPEITSYTLRSNVVYVTVSNPAKTYQTCQVLVQADADGTPMSATGSKTVAPGASATVPVVLPETPSDLIHVGLTTEGPTPI